MSGRSLGWAAIAYCALICPALAQDARVRAGAHVGFTRVVTPIPADAEWEVRQEGRAVFLDIEGYSEGFDLSGIYDLIPRDRVASVTARSDGLDIELACDCRVAPTTVQDAFVVLDVATPGVSRPTPFIPVTTPTASARPQPEQGEQAVSLPPVSGLPLDLPQLRGARPLPELARTPPSLEQQSTLADVQARLAEDLSAAATRGLVAPAPGKVLQVGRRPQIDPNLLPSPVEEEPQNDVPAPVSNIRITSSMDIPGLSSQAGPAQSMTGLVCPSGDDIDLASWSDGAPFHAQMSKARQTLYGERDRLNRPVALKLAKMYLHFGFGAEAIQVLRLDPDLARDNALLLDIGTIMEKGSAPAESNLMSLLDCPTDVALWAILAHKELDVPQTIDTDPALRALDKLPQHLRLFLAPMLSRKLLAHGDSEAAAAALRTVQRLPLEPRSDAKLAQAEIEVEEGETQEGKRLLRDVIDDNAAESPEALIAFADAQLEVGQSITPETAGLIEAYAKELKDTELGPELRRAHVIALAKSNQFDRAFKESAALGGNDETEDAINLRLQLVQELTASASDVVFLDHSFRLSSRDMIRLPKTPKKALAERLLNLGFAERAQQIIQTVPDRPLDPKRQILAARAALALRQPERAKAAIGTLRDEESVELLAEAHKLSGDFTDAADLFDRVDQETEAARAAWLAPTGAVASLSENPLFGPTVTLTERDLSPSTEIDGMIARSQSALEESEATRQTLLNLLAAPQMAIGENPEIE